ncbi:MAG: patatin-like phospholipase family protein [Proteobacteria bacterium]|nr:patatin-like phospholipase family protein [Pseudomonadota bacterium]
MSNSPVTVQDMHELERAFERDRALSKEILDDIVRSTYAYALRLASTSVIRTRAGQSIALDGVLEEFRTALFEKMHLLSHEGWQFFEGNASTGVYAWQGQWKRASLLEFYPALARMLRTTLRDLYRQCPGLDEFSLQDALSQKLLCLALGGGGGTGFVHLCLFQWLEEQRHRPSLIVGTSLGALMGYLRAIQVDYDAASSVLKLPSWWRISKNMAPYLGKSRHGLPALCRVDFMSVIRCFTQSLGWDGMPSFAELKIPFGCVTTGIARESRVVKSFEPRGLGIVSSVWQMTQLTFQRAAERAAQVARMLTAEQVTREIVLGLDEDSSLMTAADGVAFSALVPGILTYEVPHNHYQSYEALDALLKAQSLYRLCDGGLSSNVPVRAVRRAVEAGKTPHTNVYVVGVDVFAPQARDGIFYALQQIANSNVLADAPHANAMVRLKHLLSPVNLAPSLSQLKWLNAHFRRDFAPEMRVIDYAMQPLRPLAMLDLLSF